MPARPTENSHSDRRSTIQRPPQLQRFSHGRLAYAGVTGQIGDRARDAQHPVQAPTTEHQRLLAPFQQSPCGRIERAMIHQLL
jgi:hypothetical protein